MYVNIEIYNVEQRHIKVVCFSVDINYVRKGRNNAVIFNVEFHNTDQRQNNVLNVTIFKNWKEQKIYLSFKKTWLIWLTTLAFDCDQLKRKRNMERTM